MSGICGNDSDLDLRNKTGIGNILHVEDILTGIH